MFETITVPPWRDESKSYRSGFWSCSLVNNIDKLYPSNKTVLSGEIHERDPIVHRGNRVDALPYWSKTYKCSPPVGDLVFKNTTTAKSIYDYYNGCDGFNSKNLETRTVPIAMLVSQDDPRRPFPSFTSEEEHFARKVAETKAKNKLRRGVASIPMMYLERKQTVQTAANRLSDLLDIARNRHKSDLAGYRKIKGRNARKRFAKKVANDHLEMIFGWAPLIDDVAGIVEFVGEPRFDFIRAKGKQSIVRNSKVVNNVRNTHSSWPSYSSVQKTRETLGYACSLRADVTSNLGNNFRKLGFQPVYSAYDAVPLSFMLGFVSNFNSWIGSFDPLYGAEYRTGSNNRKVTRFVETEVYGVDLPTRHEYGQSMSYKTSGKGKFYSESELNVRTVLDSEPESELFFQNNLSVYSMFATISIVLQRKLKITKLEFANSPFKLKSRRRKPVYLPPLRYTGAK